MEQGWDPEVKRFFRRIINTISMGLLWLMSAATAGIYFGLGYRRPLPWVIVFYVILVITLFLLLRYFYRIWKK